MVFGVRCSMFNDQEIKTNYDFNIIVFYCCMFASK
jgi:hypothetical protein